MKPILISLFAWFSIATHAQTDVGHKKTSRNAVTEFKVKTENFEELKNFDWDTIKVVFQDNAPDQNITIAFAYENKTKKGKSKISVDNCEMKLTGKTADLNQLTAKVKKWVKTMADIQSDSNRSKS